VQRLPWLVDNGLIGLAYESLAEETAERVKAIREEAYELNPDFELAVYGVMVATAWFYHGWLRGWGTADKPLTHLTYDIATNRARDVFHNEGTHVRILGAILGVLFSPEDLEKGLFNAAARSDGYWLFQFTDFPYEWDPENPPPMNGDPGDYWKAITAANAALDAL